MSTGIFRRNPIGQLEEIPQEQLDFWCQLCQFPLVEGKCKDKASIQKCWDMGQAIAGMWHIQHECPFRHKVERCRCNDFKTIQEAFRSAGLEYK